MHRPPRRVSFVVALVVALLLVATAALAEYYKLRNVKRVDQDLYKTGDGLYIETKYCYHYTYGEDAVLKWEGRYGDNKIIWDDDSSCQVKDVWKK